MHKLLVGSPNDLCVHVLLFQCPLIEVHISVFSKSACNANEQARIVVKSNIHTACFEINTEPLC
jgi:hypothetical protein